MARTVKKTVKDMVEKVTQKVEKAPLTKKERMAERTRSA